MSEVILDVRERDEFDSEHIEHSISVPLSQFAAVVPGVLNQLREREIVIMCRSGNRARLAASQIPGLGYADKVSIRVYEGGIQEWKRQGKPTLTRKAGHLPLMRQVQLAAGLLILASVAMGVFVTPWAFALTAFFGAGLTMAGATGFCGMAMLLAKMPWNRTEPTLREELCQVSPSGKSCNQ